ncbi:MAG: peptidoglycan DD-metalloendopeptidase family protein [Clostridia bacterium]|nr:peptidoglycan DD-metalloendopeptidase family protein [Clostridia bacterium]
MRKKSKLISVIAFLAALAFLALAILPAITSVRAATKAEIQQQINNAKNKKAELQAKQSNLQNQKKDAVAEKEALDKEIAELEDQIYSVNTIIWQKDNEIAQKEQEIAEAEEQIRIYDATFKERARAMYMHGSTSYLDVLFGAQDLADLMYKFELVSRIIDYDRNILQKLADARQKIVDAKTVIENERAEQEQYRQVLQAEDDALQVALSQREAQIASINADLEQVKREEAAKEAEIQKLNDQINAMISSGQASTTYSQGSGGPIQSTGSMVWPATSWTITSEYGTRFHPIQKVWKTHTGLDIGAGYGTPIYAADSGRVILASWNGGYGKCIMVDHGGGTSTLYGHCSSIAVSVGQTVSKGQVIGYVGSTGNSTGPHLHFEVRINGKVTNPHAYVG